MAKFFWQKKKGFRKNTILDKITPQNYKKMPRWKKVLLWVLYILVAIIFLLAVAFAWFAKDLPTPAKIAATKMTQSTKIYDRTGKILLYETGDEKRTIVASDQISPNIKEATVAVEDADFYQNHGFELKAILSAVVSRLTGRTNQTRGASTITQQYVKNAFLTDDRSLPRKFKELILSIEVEFMYNKDQILTMYLNEIPYGNSTAGCEAASQMYYGKSCKDLDLAQAATLAAIPQSPTYYSPYGIHTQELVNRKNYVLDRMVTTGKISKAQADDAKKEDATTVNVVIKPRKDSILAPHFSMYVLDQIVNKYGEDAVEKQGLTIITTLDYNKQQQAQQAIDDNLKTLKNGNAQNAAIVSIDPKTGQILDMVGSVDYFNTAIDGNVNVATALRQPGSSFKIFEYSTLLKQKGFSPSKILFDLQTNFGGGYVPKNYNGRFNGPVTIRYALQNSLNIPAIKTLSLAGIDNTIRTAQDLGITSLTNRSAYGLSLALGVGEVEPVEMASAYGTLANNGNHQTLTPFLKITDSNGKTIYDFNKDHPTGNQVLDSQIAYEMSNMLTDNATRTPTFGAHSALYFSDRTIAAKTGTTQENRDGWTCGYTPSLATVVWTGNNMPSPMKYDAVEIAGPIFHDFMEKALAGTPNEQFVAPAGIQTVTVEKYSNKLPTALSKETTTDIFASWQVPTDKDDVNVQLKVCAGTDLLAPAGMADSATEEKTYTNLHSERPDNPSWEGPVLAWAAGNGMGNLPPQNYCNAANVVPTVSFSSPANNANLTGSAEISVNISNPPVPIKSVEYFIDGSSIGTGDTSNPSFPLTYNFGLLTTGSHKLSATATNQNGGTNQTNITIYNNGGNSDTITISNLGISNVSGSEATVGWATSIPTDAKVSYSTTSGGPYSTQLSTDSGLKIVHNVTLTNLSPNTKYYFKVTSADSDGNSASSQESSFTTSQ